MILACLSLTLGSCRARALSDLLRTQWVHKVWGAGMGEVKVTLEARNGCGGD